GAGVLEGPVPPGSRGLRTIRAAATGVGHSHVDLLLSESDLHVTENLSSASPQVARSPRGTSTGSSYELSGARSSRKGRRLILETCRRRARSFWPQGPILRWRGRAASMLAVH